MIPSEISAHIIASTVRQVNESPAGKCKILSKGLSAG